MFRIIGLAARARSGKDTVASLLLQHKNVVAYALADPVKIGCQVLFGLTDQETWDDNIKENNIPLWDRSPRQLFQLIGTDWMRVHNPEHWLMRAERSIEPPTRSSNKIIKPELGDMKSPFKLAAKAFFDLSDNQTWNKDYQDTKDSFWNMTPKHMFEMLESLTLKDFPIFFDQRSNRPIDLPTRKISSIEKNKIVVIKDIRFENEADFVRKHNGKIWHIVRDNAEKINEHSSELGISINAHDFVLDNNGSLEDLALAVENQWQNCFGQGASLKDTTD
ncbi:MAG: deoxynucleotide monophosphate kinase family protein [Methylobacter sp.]